MIKTYLKITTENNKELIYTFNSENKQIAIAACLVQIADIKETDIKKVYWEINEEI